MLVGHIDRSEPAARGLDRLRVLNTAAVLSANKGNCAALEPGRIRADWVGTMETEYKETPSGVSGAPQNERPGDRINPNDPRMRNRRVEIWFVPPGGAMPASVKEVRPVPVQTVCPR